MKNFSQIALKYLTYIILNKRRSKKELGIHPIQLNHHQNSTPIGDTFFGTNTNLWSTYENRY